MERTLDAVYALSRDILGESGNPLADYDRTILRAVERIRLSGVLTATAFPYLAVGDGVTDDTAAIQAAVAATVTAGGGTIYLPRGRYRIRSAINLPGALSPASSVRLVGAGWQSSVLVADANSFALITLGIYASVEHVGLDGNGYTSIDGVQWLSGNSSVSHVQITDVTRGLVLLGSTVTPSGIFYAVATQVRITTCAYGIYIETDHASTAVNWVNQNQFYSCQVRGATIAGIYQDGGDGNAFYGLDVEQNAFGFRHLSGNALHVSGSWFEANTGGHLYLAPTTSTAGAFLQAEGLESWAAAVSTTGGITSGTTALTVVSAANLVGGKNLRIAGAGVAGADLISEIVSVSGLVVTLATAASTTVAAAVVMGPHFLVTSPAFVMSEQYLRLFGPTEIQMPILGRSSPTRSGEMYGGYRARPLPGTTVFLVDYALPIDDIYWQDSAGTKNLLKLNVTSGDITFLGSIGLGAAANGVRVYSGTGSPETVVAAAKGSLYLNASGGAGVSLYVKESGTGNTGWIAK